MALPAAVPVIAVHEEVDERAREQQQPSKRAQDMYPVLLPENEQGNRRQQADAEPKRSAKPPAVFWLLIVAHDLLPFHCLARRADGAGRSSRPARRRSAG